MKAYAKKVYSQSSGYLSNNWHVCRGNSSGICPIYNLDGDEPIHYVGWSENYDLSGGSGSDISSLGEIGSFEELVMPKEELLGHWETYGYTTENRVDHYEVQAGLLHKSGGSKIAQNWGELRLILSTRQQVWIDRLTQLFGEGYDSSMGVYSAVVYSRMSCSCSYKKNHERPGDPHTHDRYLNLLKGLEVMFGEPDPDRPGTRKGFEKSSISRQLNVLIAGAAMGITKNSLKACALPYWDEDYVLASHQRYVPYTRNITEEKIPLWHETHQQCGFEKAQKVFRDGTEMLVAKVGYNEAIRLLRLTRSLKQAMKMAKGFTIVKSSPKTDEEQYFAPQYVAIKKAA